MVPNKVKCILDGCFLFTTKRGEVFAVIYIFRFIYPREFIGYP